MLLFPPNKWAYTKYKNLELLDNAPEYPYNIDTITLRSMICVW